jgi:AcrR family transcriptional regulator
VVLEPLSQHGSARRKREGPSTLRRDVARHRDKILAAARTAFDEEGVDVGVEVIARLAGVDVQ